MSILNLGNPLKGFALFSVFTLGLIFASGTTAKAQFGGYYPNNGGYYGRDRDRYRREEQKAYDKGYKHGYRDGKHAAKSRSGRYSNYGNSGGWSRGGWGVDRAYQQGYSRGYRDGFGQNRRYGRSGTIFGWPFPY